MYIDLVGLASMLLSTNQTMANSFNAEITPDDIDINDTATFVWEIQ